MRKYNVEYMALRDVLTELFEMIEIMEMAEENNIKRFGLNWKAIGTVDVNKAETFTKELEQATKITKVLNELEITVVYSEDEGFNTRAELEEYKQTLKEKLLSY